MRKALLGLLVTAIGCSDFTLVEPAPGPQVEPSLGVLLRADRSVAGSRYELRAIFFRGTDDRRRPREVDDPVLYVEGTAVQPDLGMDPGSGLWFYVWEGTRADGGAGADSVRIRAPVLAGMPSSGLTATIPIAGRDGPAEVTWAEGEDLRLRVSPAVGTSTSVSGGVSSWRLDLGESCGETAAGGPVVVSGRGAYPPELRVPWEWLLSATQPPTAACLRAFFNYRVPSAPYRTDVQIDLQLVWRVQAAGTS